MGGEPRAAGVGDDAADGPVGRAVDGVRDDRDRRLHGQPRPPVVVEADHRPAAAVGREQRRLGREIGLHGAVEVEVVLGESGEDACGVGDRVDPVQRQRVRGDLHRDRVHPALAGDGEQRLQVRRLRRGPHRRHPLAGQPRLHGADHTRPQPGGGETRLEQVRDGGLAVGAGDAEHRHHLGGAGVHLRREVAEDRTGVARHQRRQTRQRPVGERGRSSRGDRLRREGRAVDVRTGECGVQVAGSDLPRVEGDAGDGHVAFGSRAAAGGEARQRHRRQAAWSGRGHEV